MVNNDYYLSLIIVQYIKKDPSNSGIVLNPQITIFFTRRKIILFLSDFFYFLNNTTLKNMYSSTVDRVFLN